jgi:Cys-tRNA(Pro)/Cys-tRNA(Cys) deacylase
MIRFSGGFLKPVGSTSLSCGVIFMNHTNAMRLLEQAGISFRTAEYAFDEDDLNGMHAAEGIGMPPEQVFKTLVARGEKEGILVFCVPVCCELDLKKAARVSGDKKVDLIHVRELPALTGYIRGGCSPVGMKKKYPIFMEEAAMLFDEIAVSAGARGCQMILSPLDLAQYAQIRFADLI